VSERTSRFNLADALANNTTASKSAVVIISLKLNANYLHYVKRHFTNYGCARE
jgi:hypothetical protein